MQDDARPCRRDVLSELLKSVRSSTVCFDQRDLDGKTYHDIPIEAPPHSKTRNDSSVPVVIHAVEAGDFCVEREGLTPMLLVAGDIAAFIGTRAQRLVRPPANEGARIQTIRLMVGDVASGAFLRSLPQTLLTSTSRLDPQSWLLECLRHMAIEAARKGAGNSGMMMRLGELAFLDLIRCYFQDHDSLPMVAAAVVADLPVQRALNAIHSDISTRWTIAELGRCAGLSRTVLVERFQRHFGTTPKGYIDHWRLGHAAEELCLKADSIAEIAFRHGYGSEEGFARAFKRHLGVTPAAWRRRTRLTPISPPPDAP
jgi:AraC-like DNA-binding protein